MTLVLVHGNPESAAVWDDLVPHLGTRDILRLSPPGFGSPVPDGFDCSMDSYREWLVGELETLGRPVDLLGHDWGGGHVMGVVLERPDLIRSWITDVLGLFDPDYVWHDLARVWQTPDAGEAAVDQMMMAPIEVSAARYESFGMSPDVARKILAARNADMGRAILALYRSARQPMLSAHGSRLDRASARPGLALIPTDDPYCGGEVLSRRMAERAGAEVAVIEGAGHWWMCQKPADAAAAINGFLDNLG